VLYWLYDIPTVALVALFAVVFVGYTWAGDMLLRPVLRRLLHNQTRLNEMVGVSIASHCGFFGILLGLLAVATYQNLSDVDRVVTRDQSYPEPTRSETLPLIKEYVRYVIQDAWPEQRRGRVSAGGVPRMNAVQNKLFAFEPQTKGQEILHNHTVEQFNQMADVRRQRIQAADTGIAPAMWYVVGIGVLITIALFWLFEMENATQFILGGLLAFFLSTVISVLVAMDHPFRGDMSIGPDAYQAIYERMND
jgi:Protein of unknown function (DUF4239)